MTAHRFINLMIVAALAVILSTSYLLDGPSDLDALQDTAASVIDAQTAAKDAK
jgi:hypothetical protein